MFVFLFDKLNGQDLFEINRVFPKIFQPRVKEPFDNRNKKVCLNIWGQNETMGVRMHSFGDQGKPLNHKIILKDI